MRKIPTIFVRDPKDMSKVLNAWHRDCLWVRDGEGVPLRKYDGTCVMFDGQRWWARRSVRQGSSWPQGFLLVESDSATRKDFGWEPIANSGFFNAFLEALDAERGDTLAWQPGTYELCGPKINGNPEGYALHMLVQHAFADEVALEKRNYAAIRSTCLYLLEQGIEGIVFHHPDGRFCKIKGRDFR